MISSSAPNAAIVRSFSAANAFELTMRNGYPLTAHTNASELPVEPPVYSTTVWPGCQDAPPLGPLDHRQRHPVLVRTGRVGGFELHPHLGVVGPDEHVESHQRCVTDPAERARTVVSGAHQTVGR